MKTKVKSFRTKAGLVVAGATAVLIPTASAAPDADATAILTTLTDTFADVKTYILLVMTFAAVIGLIKFARRGK